jgi:hypothetical protein
MRKVRETNSIGTADFQVLSQNLSCPRFNTQEGSRLSLSSSGKRSGLLPALGFTPCSSTSGWLEITL